MKKKIKQFMAALMSGLMILGSVPVNALADTVTGLTDGLIPEGEGRENGDGISSSANDAPEAMLQSVGEPMPIASEISDDLGEQIVKAAMKYLGYGYNQNGKRDGSDGTFDCSGLVRTVLNEVGIKGSIPQNTDAWESWFANAANSDLTYSDQKMPVKVVNTLADYKAACADPAYNRYMIVLNAETSSWDLAQSGALTPGTILVGDGHASIVAATVTPTLYPGAAVPANDAFFKNLYKYYDTVLTALGTKYGLSRSNIIVGEEGNFSSYKSTLGLNYNTAPISNYTGSTRYTTKQSTALMYNFNATTYGTPGIGSQVWKIEALSEKYGVALTNNLKGKTNGMNVRAVHWPVEPTNYSGTIELHKTSSGGSVGISGAEFTVYTDAACTQNGKKMTANGSTHTWKTPEWDTSEGTTKTYYIKETKVPAGFVADTQSGQQAVYRAIVHGDTGKVDYSKRYGTSGSWVSVDTGSSSAGYTYAKIPNDQSPGSATVTIRKVDQDGNPVQGVTFAVYDNFTSSTGALGNKITESKTDSSGNATCSFVVGAGMSMYYIKETAAPAGYVMSEDVIGIMMGIVNPVQSIISYSTTFYYEKSGGSYTRYQSSEAENKAGLTYTGNNTSNISFNVKVENTRLDYYAALNIRKLDKVTNAPVSGAVYALIETGAGNGYQDFVSLAKQAETASSSKEAALKTFYALMDAQTGKTSGKKLSSYIRGVYSTGSDGNSTLHSFNTSTGAINNDSVVLARGTKNDPQKFLLVELWSPAGYALDDSFYAFWLDPNDNTSADYNTALKATTIPTDSGHTPLHAPRNTGSYTDTWSQYASVSGSTIGTALSLTVKDDVSETEHTVEKLFADTATSGRVKEITAELYRNGTSTGKTVTLNAANGWKYTWSGLEKYDASGNAYTYSAREIRINGSTDLSGYKVTYDDSVTGITSITNQLVPLYGQFAVRKVDDAGTVMKDVQFDIYSDASCTTKITSVKTGDTGIASYTLPSWYKADGTQKVFYVRENASSVDASKYTVDNSVYRITVTGSESSAASCSVQAFNVTKNAATAVDGTTFSFTVENARVILQGQFSVFKTDEDGNTLANAVFGVYTDSACTAKVTEITTDTAGYARYTLPQWYAVDGNTKTYYVKELKNDGKHVLVKDIFEVTVTGDQDVANSRIAVRNLTTEANVPTTGNAFTFRQINDSIKVDISKYDITKGQEIPGAKLQIIRTVDGTEQIVESWESTDKPHRINIPAGEYILREISAPTQHGYVKAEDVTFTVQETGAVQTVTMQDDHTELHISKTDFVTGEPVIGATLQLIDSSGNTYAEWKTDGTEKVLEYIPVGTYTLRETIPADGYATAEEVTVTVEEIGSEIRIQKAEMQDKPLTVQISKTDIVSGKEIAGATLTVYKAKADGSKGEKVTSWVTDGKPHTIEKLSQGTYVLEETYAPTEQGYVRAKSVNFTVNDTEEIQKVQMQDDFTKVDFIKIDDRGNTVSGAELVLYRANADGSRGREIARWTTDSTPRRIDYLAVGGYILVEEKTPAGYLTSEEIAFSVTETDAVQTITMEDGTGREELPVTGGIGTTIFFLMAGLTLLIGVALFIRGIRTAPEEGGHGRRRE